MTRCSTSGPIVSPTAPRTPPSAPMHPARRRRRSLSSGGRWAGRTSARLPLQTRPITNRLSSGRWSRALWMRWGFPPRPRPPRLHRRLSLRLSDGTSSLLFCAPFPNIKMPPKAEHSVACFGGNRVSRAVISAHIAFACPRAAGENPVAQRSSSGSMTRRVNMPSFGSKLHRPRCCSAMD